MFHLFIFNIHYWRITWCNWGALTAPMISVQPGIGAESIVLAFAVVVIGGLGSLPGAAIAALLVDL